MACCENRGGPRATPREAHDHVRRVMFLVLAFGVRLIFLFIAPNNGTDACARLMIARALMKNPFRLPSAVWLPLHFWLLSLSLWVWDSEWSARFLTLLLGAGTILPYWGVVRRSFDRRVAYYSTLMFALFGFHIGYSVTTSSEAPTVFFLASGVYAWVRLREDEGWRWLIAGGGALSAASLCRYEAWVYVPILSVFLLDFSQGLRSAWSNRSAWRRALGFGAIASVGAVGWIVYSLVRWGHAFAAADRTFVLNATDLLTVKHSRLYTFLVVPGASLISLGPFIAGLGICGVLWVIRGRTLPAAGLATLALGSGGAHYYAAVAKNVTMARYTLIYSWLLFPFAFEALRLLSRRWREQSVRKAFLSVAVLTLAWEAGIVLGAHRLPATVADKLAVVSPTLPLPSEIRGLTGWLKAHTASTDSIIVDEFNYESGDIARFSAIPQSRAFCVPRRGSGGEIDRLISDFVNTRHPRLLVYCERGVLGTLWKLSDADEAEVPALGLRLRKLWEGQSYRVYVIEDSGHN